jgi:hypothetical protein
VVRRGLGDAGGDVRVGGACGEVVMAGSRGIEEVALSATIAHRKLEMMMTANFSVKASTVLYPAFSVEQEQERIVGWEGGEEVISGGFR